MKATKVVLAVMAAVGTAVGGWIAWPLPAALLDAPSATSVTLLDRFGQPLRATRATDGTDRRWIALANVDPDILRGFVALEDHRFPRHHGVDAGAVLRAARDGLRAGHVVSGASTITMQLARLLVPIPRTWAGKGRQALWALRLEAHLTKQEILEQYLNRIPLGQGTVGVAAAADVYFDAAAGDLSLGQAALLASLATAPSSDNPFVDRVRAAQRRASALGRLRARGLVTERDSALADAEATLRARPVTFDAAHFTTRVLRWLEVAEGQEGRTAGGRRGGEARQQGRRTAVLTSLDLALQREIESEVRHTVATLADRGAEDAAAVVLDNASGEVLAWVGSPDFWAEPAGQVDLVTSPRQPGSALKPFLYGLAFDQGYSPASVLPDVARSYATPGGIYAPRNYDRRFHGPVRAREALASSHNVPAVDLTNRLGTGALLGVLRRAGFTSLDRPTEHYGLGLALGNGDVTLLELANAYRALVNGGTWTPWTWSLHSHALTSSRPPVPTSSRPPVLTSSRAGTGSTGDREHVSVISPVAAALVLDILADPVARIPGFGTETPFAFPFPAAVKTGTSRNFTDNWAVAVTGGFTVAVWVGDASGRPMEQVSGVTGAGPLLQRAVLRTAARYPAGLLPTPGDAGARRVTVCALSGGLAGAECPGIPEWVPADAPREACDWHRDGATVLPELYAEWLTGATGSLSRAHVLSSSRSDLPLRIISPQSGDRYSVPAGTDPRYATIALRAVTREPAVRVRWFVDGTPVPSARWRLVSGEHLVRAVADDGSSDEVRVVVE